MSEPRRAAVAAPLLALLLVTALLLPTPAHAAPGSWPPLDRASIHPGVRTVTAGAQCTANYVFTGPAGEVYVGQSAHCASTEDSTGTDGCEAGSQPVGTPVEVDGATRPGVLAWSSWVAMREALAAGEEVPDAVCAHNDFALVRLDPADHGRVNPSLPVWGGPVGIAASTSAGQQVFTFGSSGLRPGDGDAKSGTSRGQSAGGWTHEVRTLNPGVPGDSGSGFLDDVGRAFGTLSTLEVLPDPASNGVSDLALQLAWMRAHGGPPVALVDGTRRFDRGGAGEDDAAPERAGGARDRTTRLRGADRIETAVAIAREGFDVDEARAVVLGRADVAADALAGTPLAVAVDGPLLLTGRDALHPSTAAEIRRALPAGRPVYLLGGEGAIGPEVAAALAEYDVRRVAGGSRIETAVAAAEAATASPAEVLIADGRGFADALVGGTAAAGVGGVVLLVDGPRPHPAVDAYLAAHPGAMVTTVGAVAAVAYPGHRALGGGDGIATSVAVAEAYADRADVVALARADVFADALAGGALVASRGGPVLLTDRASLSGPVADHLTARAAAVDEALLLGGEAALTSAVEAQARDAIG